jgi:hypothetical protein
MYIDAGRETYYKSKRAKVADRDDLAGRPVIGSLLNPADHCEDCVALDGHWYFLDTFAAVAGGPAQYIELGLRRCLRYCQWLERTGLWIDGEIVEEAIV